MPNLKLAVRMLAKTPFVTGVAVLSLGLGIGANAAIFSMFDQLLLKSLPVVEPRQLVNISSPGPTPGSNSCNQQGGCDEIFSYPMFRDLERTQTALAGIAASRLFNASLAIDNEPFAGEGVWISGQYFNVLGVQPAMGRLIGPNDDVTIGGHYVVNISYDLWNDRFGGAADVVGKTMVLNGRSVEVIGVTPREFTGATSGARPGFYVPLVMRGSFGAIPWTGYENRREYWLYVFGRLKEGTTMERAATELTGTYRPIINDVEAPLQTGMSEQTMGVFRQKQILLAAGRQGQSDVEEEASTPLYILFAVTGTVLLIACANIANLLLARGANRAAEMGVRLALGATRRNLIGQLLTESLILAMMGGAVSLVIAKWTLDGIAALLPPDASSTLNFSIDPTVILFAAVVAIVTGILFGLFPALHSTRTDLISTIRAGAGQIAGGRAAGRFRAVLVTAQIALSTALLISSGLFLKSLVNVSRVDLGVAIDDVVTFNVVPSRVGYDTARSGVLLRRIEEELAAIPGVSGMTSSMVPLIAGSNWGTDVRVQGFECGPDTDCNANYSQVGPSFFSTMEMRLIAGRDILPSDMQGAAEVAVVNQAFVDKFNLGPDPVGKFMGWRGAQRDSMRVQIVGVVENVRYSEVKEPPPAVFYAAWHQDTRANFMNYYVRSKLPPEQMLAAIGPVLKRLEPAMPVEELKTMRQQVRENVFLDRMISILSVAFALIATLLASVGLYGVLAYSVSQRTREIGVRMALGAGQWQVKGLVLRQVGLLTVIGSVIGVAAAFGLGQAARSMLFGLEGNDPIVFTLAVILLVAVAFVAGYMPARRAAQVDPISALRYD
jgi:predicted permease